MRSNNVVKLKNIFTILYLLSDFLMTDCLKLSIAIADYLKYVSVTKLSLDLKLTLELKTSFRYKRNDNSF